MCRECVPPVISVATLQGMLKELGGGETLYGYVLEGEGKGEEGEVDAGDGKSGGVKGQDEEYNYSSAQDGESEGRACAQRSSQDGHSSQKHGTHIIHYTCDCTHTVFFQNDDDDDDDQKEVPKHSHRDVMCGRCLERARAGPVAVVDVDTEEMEQLRQELAVAKGLFEELKTEILPLERSLLGDREGLISIKEADGEQDHGIFRKEGVSVTTTRPACETLKSKSQGDTPRSTDPQGTVPAKEAAVRDGGEGS